ncbi:MAG: hypothetical protein PHT54_02410 [Candidatus Nanoarchaeia archaeon]|nr:hypothetical protein [Candidatus Nanoarchaeia archaeon]
MGFEDCVKELRDNVLESYGLDIYREELRKETLAKRNTYVSRINQRLGLIKIHSKGEEFKEYFRELVLVYFSLGSPGKTQRTMLLENEVYRNNLNDFVNFVMVDERWFGAKDKRFNYEKARENLDSYIEFIQCNVSKIAKGAEIKWCCEDNYKNINALEVIANSLKF